MEVLKYPSTIAWLCLNNSLCAMKCRRPVEDRTLVKFQWAPKTKTPQAINIKEAGNSTHSVREFLLISSRHDCFSGLLYFHTMNAICFFKGFMSFIPIF